jgi:hypothetical protein
MNIFGALLAILNVVTILGPVAGVAVVYQNHLQDMVIPPQVQSLISGNSGAPGSGGSGSLFSSPNIGLPQFVSAVADLSARSVNMVFNFTNPFNYDLMVYSVSANIVASQDSFTLGQASLVSPTDLPANQTADLSILCQWTQEAENHFQTAYSGASAIDVDVVGLTANVNGITIQSTQPYHIPNVPIGAQIAPPQFVSATPDLSARTVALLFNFTNPFSYDLMVNSVSADIVDSLDNFTLAQASLVNPVSVPAGSSANLSILCQWTSAAQDHFQTVHPNVTTIDVDVVGLLVNVNNITVQGASSYHVPNVPIGNGS